VRLTSVEFSFDTCNSASDSFSTMALYKSIYLLTFIAAVSSCLIRRFARRLLCNRILVVIVLWRRYFVVHRCLEDFDAMDVAELLMIDDTLMVMIILMTDAFIVQQRVITRNEVGVYFLTCPRRLMHVIAIGWTSVCPPVRPSHAGIVLKRLNLSSNCLHCLVAPWF